MMKTIVTTAFTLLLAAGLNAQEFEMVKNIHPSGDANPKNFAEFDGKLYFQADDGSNGIELWKTDGTETGTEMVKNIYSGHYSASPGNFIEYNGKLYFAADNGGQGYELWVTDGTEAGTEMVKDINAGSGDGSPVYLTEYNGKLYFSANGHFGPGQSYGRELWVTDGTEAGTEMVKDISAGSSDGSPSYLTEYNGKLYFSANDGTHGNELWVADGTEAGTEMVIDINPGNAGSVPSGFTEYNGKLYFRANDGSNGSELWVTDGTEAGTELVIDINSGSQNGLSGNFAPVVCNGKLFFTASDGSHGTELWVTDGTAAGTEMVKDIRSGSGNMLYNDIYLTEYNGKVFFTANDGSNGAEPWMTDGTEAGTVMLKDINTGSESSTSNYFLFTKYNGRLYFVASTSTAPPDYQLWETDGTTQNTVRLQPDSSFNDNPMLSGINQLVVFDSLLYFGAEFDDNGRELWKLATVANDIDDDDDDDDGVGIEEAALKEAISLYPNPVKDILYLQSTEKLAQIKLFSVNGQQLQSWTAQSSIDLSAYPSGIYLIQIETEKGRMSQKIVISK